MLAVSERDPRGMGDGFGVSRSTGWHLKHRMAGIVAERGGSQVAGTEATITNRHCYPVTCRTLIVAAEEGPEQFCQAFILNNDWVSCHR